MSEVKELHNSAAKLLIDISVPTEERQPQVSSEPAPVFAMPEMKTEIAAAPAENTGTVPAPVIPIKEPPSKEMMEAGAEVAIGMFDLSQNKIFKFFVNKKKNRKLEKHGSDTFLILERLISEAEKGKQDFTPDEITLLRIEKNVQEVLNDLPLTEDEKKSLRIPLLELMKQHGGTIPPNIQLMLAVLMIAGGRTADVMIL